MNPAAAAVVLQMPKTLPAKSGATSETIGQSPADANPMKNIDKARRILMTVTFCPIKGIEAKAIAGKKTADRK